MVKKQVLTDVKTEIGKQIFGVKDSTNKETSVQSTKEKATETLKNTFGNLLKKKKAAADTTSSNK